MIYLREPRIVRPSIAEIEGVSGGSGSGSGTVTTDGVTIQGNGSAGSPIALLDAETDGVTLTGAGISASPLALKAVQTAARLTGAGTVASPLDIVGWPLSNWVFITSQNIYTSVGQNQLHLVAYELTAPVQFSKMGFNVGTADASNDSDVGLYNSAGSLIANIGAQILSATGFQKIATVQGVQTITPGLYFAAFTTAGSVLTLGAYNSAIVLYGNANFGSSSGGALPSSISPPTLSPATVGLVLNLYS